MPTFLAEEQKFVPWIAEMKKIYQEWIFHWELNQHTQKVTQAVSMELKILLQQYCDEIYGNDI